MPQFTTPEGHTFTTEYSLLDMVAKFVRNPGPANWSRLELAMLAHQQAHYIGEVDLIQDVCTMSVREINALLAKVEERLTPSLVLASAAPTSTFQKTCYDPNPRLALHIRPPA